MGADPAVSQSPIDFVLGVAPSWRNGSRLTAATATWQGLDVVSHTGVSGAEGGNPVSLF